MYFHFRIIFVLFFCSLTWQHLKVAAATGGAQFKKYSQKFCKIDKKIPSSEWDRKFIKKETQATVSSRDFYEIFESIFFIEHFRFYLRYYYLLLEIQYQFFEFFFLLTVLF